MSYMHSLNRLPAMNTKNLCPAALVSTALESIVSWQGIEHMTPVLEARFLTTGRPWMPYRCFKANQALYQISLEDFMRRYTFLHHVTPGNIHDSVPERRFSNGLFNLAFLHNLNILYGKQTGDSSCCPCMELDEHPHNWATAPLIPAASKPALCLEPKVTGDCNATMTRYFYNPQTGLCEQFVYSGCEGNGNNFENLEDCMKTCSQEAGSLW